MADGAPNRLLGLGHDLLVQILSAVYWSMPYDSHLQCYATNILHLRTVSPAFRSAVDAIIEDCGIVIRGREPEHGPRAVDFLQTALLRWPNLVDFNVKFDWPITNLQLALPVLAVACPGLTTLTLTDSSSYWGVTPEPTTLDLGVLSPLQGLSTLVLKGFFQGYYSVSGLSSLTTLRALQLWDSGRIVLEPLEGLHVLSIIDPGQHSVPAAIRFSSFIALKKSLTSFTLDKHMRILDPLLLHEHRCLTSLTLKHLLLLKVRLPNTLTNLTLSKLICNGPLEAREGLPQLTALEMADLEGLHCAHLLPLCTRLTSLNLQALTFPDRALSSVGQMAGLESLVIESVRGYPGPLQLPNLGALEQLWHVQFRGMHVASFQPLAGVGRLDRLSLRDCESAEEVPAVDMAVFTSLTSLLVTDCKQLLTQQVSRLTSLEELDCNVTPVPQVSTLTRLRKLTLVCRSYDKAAEQLDLQNLKSLEELTLFGRLPFSTASLSPLTSLTSLCIACNEAKPEDMCLNLLVSLQSLDLTFLPLTTFPDLQGLTKLRTVTLDRLDFSGKLHIRNLPSLKFIELDSVRELQDVAITNCPKLVAINGVDVNVDVVVNGCPKLTTISMRSSSRSHEYDDL